jgi:MFS family permease
LNSTLFNSAQLIGPAVAGMMIAAIGTGWLFFINGLSFIAVLTSLTKMRRNEIRQLPRAAAAGSGMIDGLRYVWRKPGLVIALTMLFLVGTYGLNFPIFMSTMTVTAFHGGPHLYGILSSAMAAGSVVGALLAAGREQPRLAIPAGAALVFGVVGTLAAMMPNIVSFGAVLVALGAVAQTFTTSTNSFVQLQTEPSMRGRVMAIYMAIFFGCTPLGAPLIGWVADVLGPRYALGVGASSGFAAALFAYLWYRRHHVKDE